MNFKVTCHILYLSYSSIFDAATENRGVLCQTDYAGYDVETIPVNLTNKYRWQCKPMLLLSLCKIFSCMTLRPHVEREKVA